MTSPVDHTYSRAPYPKLKIAPPGESNHANWHKYWLSRTRRDAWLTAEALLTAESEARHQRKELDRLMEKLTEVEQ